MTNYKIAKKNIGGENVVLEIKRDDDVVDCPRDWDNLGTMVCWHSRYMLGDSHDFGSEEDFIISLAQEVATNDYIENKMEDHFKGYTVKYFEEEEWAIVDSNGEFSDYGYEEKEDAEDYLEEMKDDFTDYYFENDDIDLDEMWELINEHFVILPLYLYDHSGITMNTSGFSCSWDSGQVGYIYASKEKFRKETGYTDKELFEDNKAEELLVAEVKIYDQYLRGDVYGFVLEKEVYCDSCGSVEKRYIDSCWGFYGDEYDNDGWGFMKEQVQDKYHVLFDELEDAF